MINDCAYVGETLIKYLPSEIEVLHIKRSRRLFNKTFGITWNILKAKGDVYHVHYLLQDCYLTLKLGKRPVIGHAHGSDLRKTINHKVWGRIVRHNLKNCYKVLVSTPEILEKAKEFNENSEYLPNPVDTSIFYPKPVPKRSDNRLHVLLGSPHDWKIKGNDIAIRALSKVKEKVKTYIIRYGSDFEKTLNLAHSLKLPVVVLPKVSHEKLREYYWAADVVIDQFRSGVQGQVTLEAIACGRPVITYISSVHPVYKDFPLKDVNTEEKIVSIILDAKLQKLKEREFSYLRKHHMPEHISNSISKIYFSAIEQYE
jgi:glycosyltransferase involved in cell wall biosynthesis